LGKRARLQILDRNSYHQRDSTERGGQVAHLGSDGYTLSHLFIVPARPKIRTSPPPGDAWIHEIKFDGWRIQLHKEGRSVAIYTKNGHRCAHKVELIAAALTQPTGQIVHHRR
jgi:ATP-dependent DNA ligase